MSTSVSSAKRLKSVLDDDEYERLVEMLKAEDSHLKQWPKIVFALTTVGLNLTVTLLRANMFPDLLQVPTCSSTDWLLLSIFVTLMLVFSALGILWNRKEIALKQKANKGLIDSDITYKCTDLTYLFIGGLGGGWVGGALGLGGGSIFNPLMISMGMPPSVATSTSSYMIMLSTGASCVMYTLYGMLDMTFAIWLSFWCAFGIILGIMLLDWLINKFHGRQSLLVFFLVGMLLFSALLVAVDTVVQWLEKDPAKVAVLWSFSDFCEV
jgi:hypothetical protein